MIDTWTNAMLPPPDDPWGYADRRVVVTGAASGMGLAATQILVALGAQVVAVDIQDIPTPGVAERHRLDLADSTAIDDVAATIGEGVDALFNIAGIPGTAPAATVLAVNFCGLHRFTERLVPSMPAGAAICSIGSTSAANWPYHVDEFLELLATDDEPGGPAMLEWLVERQPDLGYPYDVSKEAVNVYTAWRAGGLAERGIRINCVNPGGTRTPASKDFSTVIRSKAGGPEMLEHWPMLFGRMSRPDEQAWPMVFLNGPFASFVTGASLYVDAGLMGGLVTGQHHPAVARGMSWRPPVPAEPRPGVEEE